MEPIKARMSSLLDPDTVQREISFAMHMIEEAEYRELSQSEE